MYEYVHIRSDQLIKFLFIILVTIDDRIEFIVNITTLIVIDDKVIFHFISFY